MDDNNKVNYCTNCGEKIDSDTIFCPNCGNKVVFDIQESDKLDTKSKNTFSNIHNLDNPISVNNNKALKNILASIFIGGLIIMAFIIMFIVVIHRPLKGTYVQNSDNRDKTKFQTEFKFSGKNKVEFRQYSDYEQYLKNNSKPIVTIKGTYKNDGGNIRIFMHKYGKHYKGGKIKGKEINNNTINLENLGKYKKEID